MFKADRIREQGDTISYTVGSFAQAQDRSIGDVLKRMPGITAAPSADALDKALHIIKKKNK